MKMRKLFALAMMAMLAFAAVSCGQKAAEETPAPAATETAPTEEMSMPADTGSTMMSDTTAHH